MRRFFLCLLPIMLSAATSTDDVPPAERRVDPDQLRQTTHFEFDIYRRGDDIGDHVIGFFRDGDELVVQAYVRMKIKFGFIVGFRYELDAQERWRGEDLVSMWSSTRQGGVKGGDDNWVQIVREDDQLKVESALAEPLSLPGDTLVSSHWHPDRARVEVLINGQKGELEQVESEKVGIDTMQMGSINVPTHRMRLTGGLNIDYLESESGCLLGLAFTPPSGGDEISYKLKHLPKSTARFNLADEPLLAGCEAPAKLASVSAQ